MLTLKIRKWLVRNELVEWNVNEQLYLSETGSQVTVDPGKQIGSTDFEYRVSSKLRANGH